MYPFNTYDNSLHSALQISRQYYLSIHSFACIRSYVTLTHGNRVNAEAKPVNTVITKLLTRRTLGHSKDRTKTRIMRELSKKIIQRSLGVFILLLAFAL